MDKHLGIVGNGSTVGELTGIGVADDTLVSVAVGRTVDVGASVSVGVIVAVAVGVG
jgi:hypothetical protein